MTILSKDSMAYVWVYSQAGADSFSAENTTQYTIYLPKDTYEIITGNAISKHTSWTIVENAVEHIKSDTVVIDKNKATIKNIYQFYREDGFPLHINSFSLTYLNQPNYYDANVLGVSDIRIGIDSTAFVHYFNQLPKYLYPIWLAKGKQLANNGNIYLLDGKISNNNGNLTIENDPLNYTSSIIDYSFSNQLNNLNSQIHLATKAPGFYWGIDDPSYYMPFSIRVFTDTSNGLKFSQDVNFGLTYGNDLQTAEIYLDKNKVFGYNSPLDYDKPFVISETHEIHLGRTPVFWYGRFHNTSDSIRIRGEFGYRSWHQLFLTQTNDILRHGPYMYKIRSGNIIFYQDSLRQIYWNYAPPLQFGYSKKDLSFAVDSSNCFFSISDNKSEVAGVPAKTEVTASFNLALNDKNPPYLDYFQMLSGNEIANILIPDAVNRIRFRARDDGNAIRAHLYLSLFQKNEWLELPLQKKEMEYSTSLPVLSTGFYSLKLVLDDAVNNQLEIKFKPAFRMGIPTAIETNADLPLKFDILAYYPNPFNSTIAIKYATAATGSPFSLKIYDVLGRQIKTLVNSPVSAGTHIAYWFGKNNSDENVSSGIYFIVLKGGGQYVTRKILLVK